MIYITNVKTTWRKDDSWWQIYNCSQIARTIEKLEFGFFFGGGGRDMEAYS